MVNVKLIIPIIVAVVIVVVAVMLLLPGLTGGGTTTETPTETQPTTTPTGGGGQQTGTRASNVTYYINAEVSLRDPTPEERSQGILKVAEFDYRVTVTGTIYIKRIIVEVGDKNYTVKEYSTPFPISNKHEYRIPLKLKITTQEDLDRWNNARRVIIYTVLEVEGQEIVYKVPALVTGGTGQATSTPSIPGGGPGIR